MERQPETVKPPERYSVPNPLQSVKVKVEVMQRVKGGRVDLVRHVQMPQVRARTGRAGVAAARRVERPIVLGITGISDVDASLAGKQLAVAGIAGGEHAVEQIDPT